MRCALPRASQRITQSIIWVSRPALAEGRSTFFQLRASIRKRFGAELRFVISSARQQWLRIANSPLSPPRRLPVVGVWGAVPCMHIDTHSSILTADFPWTIPNVAEVTDGGADTATGSTDSCDRHENLVPREQSLKAPPPISAASSDQNEKSAPSDQSRQAQRPVKFKESLANATIDLSDDPPHSSMRSRTSHSNTKSRSKISYPLKRKLSADLSTCPKRTVATSQQLELKDLIVLSSEDHCPEEPNGVSRELADEQLLRREFVEGMCVRTGPVNLFLCHYVS